jgi:hypothetical protein
MAIAIGLPSWRTAAVAAAAIALAVAGCARAGAADFRAGDSEPEVDAMRSVVPDALLAAARADSSVHLHEVVLYAFVPHGAGYANAVLFTDSAVVRRSPGGGRRHQRPFDVAVTRAGTKRGLLVVTPRAGVPDTLYGALTDSEVARLVAAAAIINRAPIVRPSRRR